MLPRTSLEGTSLTRQPSARTLAQTHMTDLREITTDAIKYWERLRIAYNLILAAIVLCSALACGAAINTVAWWPDVILQLFVYAVIANMLYCAAYLVDFFVQLSAFQIVWRKARMALFIVGTLLAGILAWLAASAMFMSPFGACD